MGFSITAIGAEELERKTTPKILYKPIRELHERMAEEGFDSLYERSPVEDGTLQSSFRKGAKGSIFKIDPTDPVRFVQFGTKVTSSRGFNYPRALDAGTATSKSTGNSWNYHYRATARAGQRTQGWFMKAITPLSRKLKAVDLIRAAEKAIREQWERG